MTSPPKCFISYSWESQEHNDWVRKLAESLVHNGVDVRLDQWDMSLGDQILRYMEGSVRDSDFVLLICTPIFAQKANAGKGGVGYETNIVTGEIFIDNPSSGKFIPVLRRGSFQESLPSYLKSIVFIDFRDDVEYKKCFENLLRRIYKEPRFKRPPLGRRPSFEDDNLSSDNRPLNSVLNKDLKPLNFIDIEKSSSQFRLNTAERSGFDLYPLSQNLSSVEPQRLDEPEKVKIIDPPKVRSVTYRITRSVMFGAIAFLFFALLTGNSDILLYAVLGGLWWGVCGWIYYPNKISVILWIYAAISMMLYLSYDSGKVLSALVFGVSWGYSFSAVVSRLWYLYLQRREW